VELLEECAGKTVPALTEVVEEQQHDKGRNLFRLSAVRLLEVM
jgi:hypothetical protein